MEDKDFLHEEHEVDHLESMDGNEDELKRPNQPRETDNPDDPNFGKSEDDDETELPEDFDADVDPDVGENMFPSAP